MAKIGRPIKALVVTEDERRTLLRLTKRPRVNRSLAFRARLVLACAEGTTNSDVARRYRTTNATVGKWRGRFIERRLDGIYDEPRVGAPRRISDEDVEAVILKTLETTPPGETHWSTRTMATKAGMSHTTVGRIWQTFGLKPHVTESFKISPDPQLIEKIYAGVMRRSPAASTRTATSQRAELTYSLVQALGLEEQAARTQGPCRSSMTTGTSPSTMRDRFLRTCAGMCRSRST